MKAKDQLSCPKLHLSGPNEVTWSSGRIPPPLCLAPPSDIIHLIDLPFWKKTDQTYLLHQQSVPIELNEPTSHNSILLIENI